ncbi:MAG: restriction endonuclease subunit S [Gemmataceae bacterium]
MDGRWESTTLGAEVDLLTGFPFKSEGYTDVQASIPLVRGDNIVQGSLRWDGVKRWPLSRAADHAAYQLQAGDVVLAMDRPWIEAGLKYAAISRFDLPCLLVQRTSRIRGGAKLDVGFLRYLIGSREFTQHILAVQTGTAVPHISASQIKAFAFRRPPLDVQKRIAEVLGSLDDKIELNRRMNATLEAMARALFQSWFVDFDPVRAKLDGRRPAGLDDATADLFPSSFHESTVGPIPHGWTAGRLADVGMNHRRTVQPSEIASETAYIALDHMPRRSIALAGWDESADVASGKSAFKKGEILFGKLRPYFHKVGVAPVDGVCSTDILVIAPKSPEWFGFLLGHVSSEELILFTDQASTGTKMPRTNWADIGSFKVAIPPQGLAASFTTVVQPLLDRIVTNLHQSRTLASLRDTLLPKLLSGELSVAGIEARL